MKIKHWKLSKTISAIYILLVAILFVIGLTVLGLVDFGPKAQGFVCCYGTDAMLFGFECSGFNGSEIVGFALNYPLYHLYMPMFVMLKPTLIFAVIGMWFFPVLFLISIKKLGEIGT